MSTTMSLPSSFQWSGLKSRPFTPSLSKPKPIPPIRHHSPPFTISLLSPRQNPNKSPLFPSHPLNPPQIPRLTTSVSAGRSKKKPGGPSPGRIEGDASVRRQAKLNARRRSRRLSQNLFYRRNSQNSGNPDSFSEAELQAIGLGYDRAVRFMDKDDPNLKHPYDWYKYGKYGPYSWRGIVVGPPIRGRFSDDRVSLIEEVRDHEEWEKIEQFEMESDFSPRLQNLDKNIGFRYYWVFVRHPKWKASDLPWQQWTLASEVALEAGKDARLDKWSLMGRLGNKTRAMITQCAAWQRPDIIYVKKPVYQCRFEPQDGFFSGLMPLLDPETEGEFAFELRMEDGRVEMCTYFGGLCKIVKISPKAYVDDVVNAYERLSDEEKLRCLEFLLTNHPMELLHPYTKEWKSKLEELELGCDAPDESDDEIPIMDWNEEEDGGGDDEEEEEEEESEDDAVIDVGDDGESEEAEMNPEESEDYWNEQWNKVVNNPDEMEKLVTKSMEVTSKFYKRQMDEEQQFKERMEDVSRRNPDENWEQGKEDWESEGYKGPRRRVKKSKVPPELFLRAAVRPFTYRNLVKEIVLMRHAIIDGDIKRS